jgi:cystathionine beta-lyase family protein involved in aluminum resistance
MQFSPKLLSLAAEAEAALAGHFARIDGVSFANTSRVLDTFRTHRVSDAHFAGTSGYGYDDRGRETLDASTPISSVPRPPLCGTPSSTAPRL